MNIIDYIGTGKESAITRASLRALTGLSDRKVRLLIAQARKDGCMIANAQNGGGYFIPSDLDEIERQYWQTQSRSIKMLAYQKPYRDVLKEAGRL